MNSLVGSSANDLVGDNPATNTIALSNGNYVIATPSWDSGAVVNVGAVVFGSGLTGISGEVSASNALIGSTAQDKVGFGGITALGNGNYVVRSSNWNNGAATNAGAVTFASGEIGLVGVVSAFNSMVGGTRDDVVGSGKITALANGNYVVSSFNWDNGALVNIGAATWGSGVAGCVAHRATGDAGTGTVVSVHAESLAASPPCQSDFAGDPATNVVMPTSSASGMTSTHATLSAPPVGVGKMRLTTFATGLVVVAATGFTSLAPKSFTPLTGRIHAGQ
jgi:hypothetical protein